MPDRELTGERVADAILLNCQHSTQEFESGLSGIIGYIYGDKKGRFEDGEKITTTSGKRVELSPDGSVIIQTKNTLYRCYFVDATNNLALSALASRWMPIADAPKDGTELWLGKTDEWRIPFCQWVKDADLVDGGQWMNDQGADVSGATHFMPLPLPPQEAKREG